MLSFFFFLIFRSQYIFKRKWDIWSFRQPIVWASFQKQVHCIFVQLTNTHAVFITKQITFIGHRKLSKSEKALRCTEVQARRGDRTLSNLLLTWQHPVPRCAFRSPITIPNVRVCESVLVRFAFSSVIRLSVFHPAASL